MTSFELEHAIGFSGNVPHSVHFHPNGQDFVYVAGGTIVICDLNDSHNQVFLRGHDDEITCLVISSSGRYLASGQRGDNSDVIVWDFEARSMLYRFSEHDHGISCLSFSEDEKLLVSAGDAHDRRLIVWDLSCGGMVAFQSGVEPVDTVTMGGFEKDVKRRPTRNYVIATGGNKKLTLWTLDPYAGELRSDIINIASITRDYRALRFSADGEFLYAGTDSGDFAVIQMKSLVFAGTIRASANGIKSLVTLRNGGLCVGGGDGSLVAYSGQGKELTEDARTYLQGAVMSLSVTHDEVELLAGTSRGFLHRARIRDLMDLVLLEAHSAPVTAVAFNSGFSDRFVTVSADGSFRQWDSSDYTTVCKGETHGSPASCAVYLTEVILVGCEDGKIRCFHSDTGEFLWDLTAHSRAKITALAASHNEKFFITGAADGEIRVWLLRSREMVSSFREHSSGITQLKIFEDDAHALSSSRDRSMFAWDLRAERRVNTMTQRQGAINDFALVADQTQVLSVGQDKRISYWDLRTAAPYKLIDAAHSDDIRTISLSHGNAYVATGSADQIVKLWDFEGALLSEGIGHSAAINRVQFSPDDRQLVSVGDDMCVFLWNVYPG